MLEKAVADTEGAVELAKVNVDENPRVAQTFAVQSIPAVFAIQRRPGGGPVHRRRCPRRRSRRSSSGWRPRPSEADTLVAAGRRGLAAPGPRARAGPRRGHRGPGPAPDRPGRRRRRAGAAGAHPRDRGQPGAGRRGPPARGRGRRLRHRPRRDGGQARRAARAGARRRRAPARSSSTCSRRWAPTTRAPTSTGGRWRRACSDGRARPPGRRRPTRPPLAHRRHAARSTSAAGATT